MQRRKTKTICIGNVCIGSSHPVAVQAMAKTQTKFVRKTVNQIKRLQDLGAKFVRVAVKDMQDAQAVKKIKQKLTIPLVADIHFDYNLAIESIKNGIDKIRLNPGNIYKKDEIAQIVKEAKGSKIPIRIGVNSGSLKNPGSSVAKQMVQSALSYIKLLESFYFYDIVVSLKSSNVLTTIQAYLHMARYCDYPFHIGITATGPSQAGIIKSSVGIGALLNSGVGDTIRVSLTETCEDEVRVAYKILDALGLQKPSFEIISCPTCGRCQVDLIKIVKQLENKIQNFHYRLRGSKPIKIAIMGCVVNGPGEAKEADLGIAFGKANAAVLFKDGRIIRKISKNQVVEIVLKNIFSKN